MAELVQLPLHDNLTSSSDESRPVRTVQRTDCWPFGQLCDLMRRMDCAEDSDEPCSVDQVGLLIFDLAASVIFWYFVLIVLGNAPDAWFFSFWGALLGAMILWRFYRAYTVPPDDVASTIPYTCGFAAANGKEVFLVATVHISPRAPKDVEAVIGSTQPDITMIELDEERLDRMRDEEAERSMEPNTDDLQPIRITAEGCEPTVVYAQRALWNAERTGQLISGKVIYDEDNSYGLEQQTEGLDGSMALVQRGSENGEFAPFALKAHCAARAGAEAVLVINQEAKLPINRIGGGTLMGDLRVACRTFSCGFPPIPLVLLPRDEGEKLREMCLKSKSAVQAELEVLPDSYPRRTLRRRLCQASALMFSGIGVLYGVIGCFNVDVGAEFLAAEVEASNRGIPCTCIDVDLNSLLSRLGYAVIPTPCNLMRAVLAWLAFPRVAFRALFPGRGYVDVTGSMILHGASFPLKNWVAFILAGVAARFVTGKLLELLGFGAAEVAEKAGAVDEKDVADVQTYIMLLIEFYMLPRIYEAIVASRDEAMYRGIVAKGKEFNTRRAVVVVGAGHANGILRRIRNSGL